MHLGISTEKRVRSSFVAGLAVTVLFAGIIVAERAGIFAPPMPSPGLVASVLPGAVIALTNEERKDYDLGSLKASELLNRAAQLKAEDMAAKSYYAHVSPDGTIPPYWLNRVGYKYQVMGENLVIDRQNSQAVVSAWMGSHDHRENILNPSFTEIGVGVAHGEYKGTGTIYVVQMLAKPQASQVAATRVAVAPTPPPTPPIPAPTPTRSAATTAVLVRAPEPKPVVQDPIAPVLKAVASTTLADVPSIVASTSFRAPALAADTGAAIELAPESAPQARPALGARMRAFVGIIASQLRDFLAL